MSDEEAFFQRQHQMQEQRLRDMHPANWENPPLPRSKYLRIKSTGEVVLWHAMFANRPDLCDCCDEQGNILPPESVVPEDPAPILNTRIDKTPSYDRHAPPVGALSQMFGLAEPFSGDFTEKTTRNDAFVLPQQNSSVDMSTLISAVFKDNVG